MSYTSGGISPGPGPVNQRQHKYAFVTPPGSEELFCDFKFLATPYPNPGIEISADRLRAKRTSNAGRRIVFFNHKIDIGMGFAMKTLAMSGPRLKYSYMFGATTCTKTTIQTQDSHVKELCGEGTACGGKSLTSELWNCSKPGDFITIIRGQEQFKIEVSNGRDRKEYLKWIPNSRVETLDWYPFIILDAEVDAVEFIPNWRPTGRYTNPASPLVRDPRPRNAGITELADNLVQGLGDADFPAIPNSVPKQRSISKASAPPATLTQVPAVKVECHFLQTSYPLENIVLKLGLKQAERNNKSGARLVYLRDVFADGTMFSLTVVKDNSFGHQKDHTFVFGLTSCEKKAILKYDSHKNEMCSDSSNCAGISCQHRVAASAHAGSTVTFQKKSDVIDITIISAKVRSIEVMRIPPDMRGKPVFPFFQLSGNADAICLASDGAPPATGQSSISGKAQSEKDAAPSSKADSMDENWRKMQSLSLSDAGSDAQNGNGDIQTDDEIKFLVLPYPNNAVRYTNGNTKVQRTSVSSPMPIFFDREIEVGMTVILEAESAAGFVSGTRFEFGFTSCTISQIISQKCHMRDSCSRSECTGESHATGMRYNANFAAGVTVTRTPEYFAFDYGKGADRKRFQKHPPEGKRGPDYHWIPFIRLNGDADAIQIVAVTRKAHSFYDRYLSDSPIPRHRERRSASPAVSVTSTRSGYMPQNGRRSSEARITPVRVVNARPTTKAFAQSEPPATAIAAYRNPMGLTSTSIPEKTSSFLAHAAIEKKAHAAAAKITDPKLIPSASLRENKSAAAAPPKRKWFSNAVVVFEDPILKRVDVSADAKCYIFSSKFQLNEKIGFKLIDSSDVKSKIMFGVTTEPLLRVDTGDLPVDAASLIQRPGWFVYPHLATCVGSQDGLAVVRSQSGISLMLPHDPESGHQIISGIDSSITVCPFFQFSGCNLEILYDV